MSKIQDVVNCASNIAVESAVVGGIGYLCARVFMLINPVHTAVACAVGFAISKATKPIFEKIFANENSNQASRVLGMVISDFIAIVPVAVALGCPPISLSGYLCLLAIIAVAGTAMSMGKASVERQERYLDDIINL